MTKKIIQLDIGELVLDGIDRKDPAQVGRAVETQLARMIEEGGGLPEAARGFEVKSVQGRPVSVHGGQSASLFGATIARSIYGSW